LYVFFGMFIGLIQAFVFTMLTLVYISVQVK
jgi:F-type H+-transporting ATPase subunit a